MLDDIRGYKALMSAVVNRAIMDSLIQPHTRQKFSPVARNAIEFLMGDNVGLYLEFIDIDPDYFKTKFINSMFDDKDDPSFNAVKKRMFRLNYKRYEQEKSKNLIMKATYRRRRK